MFVSAFKVSIYPAFSLPGAANISLTCNKGKKSDEGDNKAKGKGDERRRSKRKRERKEESNEKQSYTICKYLFLAICLLTSQRVKDEEARGGTSIFSPRKKEKEGSNDL